MTKKDRAEFILSYLKKKYPKTPIPLKHKNKFELLRPKGLQKLWFLFLLDDISASLAEVKTKSTGN